MPDFANAIDVDTQFSVTSDRELSLLTFPSGAAVKITAPSTEFVADHVVLLDDPSANLLDSVLPDEGPNRGLRAAIKMFTNLQPLNLKINEVPHLAARIGDKWTVLPMDASKGFTEPHVTKYLAHAQYYFDRGNPGAGNGGEYIGVVRPGLMVSWDTWDDGVDCKLQLSAEDTIEFMVRELRQWTLYPAVLDGLLGTHTKEDNYLQDICLYEGTWGVGLNSTSADAQRLISRLLPLHLDGDPMVEAMISFLRRSSRLES